MGGAWKIMDMPSGGYGTRDITIVKITSLVCCSPCVLVCAATSGIIIGMLGLIAYPGTKFFPMTAGDNAVLDWAYSPNAFNIRKVQFEHNHFITVQALEALED